MPKQKREIYARERSEVEAIAKQASEYAVAVCFLNWLQASKGVGEDLDVHATAKEFAIDDPNDAILLAIVETK